MSDLSTQVHDLIHNIAGVEPGDDVHQLAKIIKSDDKDAPPGLAGAHFHYDLENVQALRILYREMNGAAPWKDNQEALDSTEECCGSALVNLSLSAFADGFAVAKDDLKVVKKYKFYSKMDQIFDVDTFRSESELYCLALREDIELVEEVERFVRLTAASLAGITVFLDPQYSPSKIWDLWWMTGNSVTATMYIVGHTIGTRWKENDTLSGILAASEQKDS